jgi:hypothetical protein
MSDAEIIAVMICFHCGSFRNLKHFHLFYVAEHLQSEFPGLLSYSCFVELERKVMIPFALFLKLICFGECTGITYYEYMLKLSGGLYRTQVNRNGAATPCVAPPVKARQSNKKRSVLIKRNLPDLISCRIRLSNALFLKLFPCEAFSFR